MEREIDAGEAVLKTDGEAVLRQLYDLMKWGPTSANCSPARFIFVTTPEAKAKLVAGMSPGNVEKTTQAPVIKAEQVKVKPGVLKANAKMGRHHVRHVAHHRSHQRIGALKSHQFSKVTIKHASFAAKRG